MNKKLVYSFYLTNDSFDKEINKLHFNCLKHYLHIFDEVSLTIIKDEEVKAEKVHELENFFLNNFNGDKISFITIPNQELRETFVFNEEIVKKLSENGNNLVFFAHNKGISNLEKYDKRTIFIWVAGMYYYSLNFIDDVEYNLISRPYISYGSFLTQVTPLEETQRPKYGWCYIGTYFWINSQKLNDYIDLHNVRVPYCSDRYFDEEYLGNIYPMQPSLAASHMQRYIINAENYYLYAENYLHTLYGEAEDFYEFYNKIIEFGNDILVG